MTVDLDRLRRIGDANNRYQQQLNRLSKQRKQTDCIEAAVTIAHENIAKNGIRSFVIYGEPQSGKTEMMICLTAKLIDSGHSVIVHLLNDSVQLLQQNLDRFQRSGLAPAAKHFSDLLDPTVSLKTGQHVIFCKKNAKDLQRLIPKLSPSTRRVIVDDEADFATPNARINRGDVTKINELVGRLIGQDGIYIGVTATPARLDLNNTFDNDNEKWIDFPPHAHYTGQDAFFPLDLTSSLDYRLKLLPDKGDNPKYLREALFRFLVTVAYVNLNSSGEENYSFLIHTSGKRIDHKADKRPIDAVFQALSDVHSSKFERYSRSLASTAEALYGAENTDPILEYIIRNRTRHNVIVMNSDRGKNVDFKSATDPAALFTIIIGGNIVSRGVTFDRLISMFFTRDAKHRIQQDTYIQRARMFGSRKDHLTHFELTIPQQLYMDWHRCFVFHTLALEAIKAGLGSPVWLSDRRISAVASPSIDMANVVLDKGEMSFPIFDYDPKLETVIESAGKPLKQLRALQASIGKECVPDYVLNYVEQACPLGDRNVAVHESSSIAGYRQGDGVDLVRIERRKGFFGAPQMQKQKFPDAIHHFKIFYNGANKGRLFYKFEGSIKFIKNLKNV